MIESILKFLNRYAARLPDICIPQDKQAHFISGAILFFLLLACQIPAMFAVAVVSLIGVAKEIYDHYHPLVHTCDVYDWLATTLGGLAAFAVWWVT